MRKKLTKEEKLARMVGRINNAKAGQMFDDVNEAVIKGRQLDMAGLAAKYDVDPVLLERVLHFNRTPVVKTEPDGTKIALPWSATVGG